MANQVKDETEKFAKRVKAAEVTIDWFAQARHW